MEGGQVLQVTETTINIILYMIKLSIKSSIDNLHQIYE